MDLVQDDNWEENTTTWNTKPLTTFYVTNVTVLATQPEISINLFGICEGEAQVSCCRNCFELDKGDKILSIRLYRDGGQDTVNQCIFWGRQDAVNFPVVQMVTETPPTNEQSNTPTSVGTFDNGNYYSSAVFTNSDTSSVGSNGKICQLLDH